MTRDSVRAEIDRIVKNRTLAREGQIEALQKLYSEVRAEQRAATESSMVDDTDLGAELIDIETALESLGAKVIGPEDKGAATL